MGRGQDSYVRTVKDDGSDPESWERRPTPIPNLRTQGVLLGPSLKSKTTTSLGSAVTVTRGRTEISSSHTGEGGGPGKESVYHFTCSRTRDFGLKYLTSGARRRKTETIGGIRNETERHFTRVISTDGVPPNLLTVYQNHSIVCIL